MSQNKTVIQGLEAADTNIGGGARNFYARGENSNPAKGTVVPGMNFQNPGNPTTQPIENPAQPKAMSGKPVVGFLYSVSKSPFAEYWPLHLGRNTIGQSTDSDIVLTEGTVSASHATIIVRQGKSGLIAAIKDTESTNGTFINNEPIDFAAEECHNGDIITIGQNYQLLFILIDAAKLGLATSKDFIQAATQEPEDEFPEVPSFGSHTTQPGGFDPAVGSQWGNNDFYTGGNPTGGTVGMDGSTPNINHGGTVPM